MVRAFIQAGMRSSQFPGKILAPLAGRPLIAHLLTRVARVLPLDHITLVTSTDASDDPLECYVRASGVSVYRGPVFNPFERLQDCLQAFPCTWFFHLSADGPLLTSALLQTMLAYSDWPELDLVTNVYPRTFPKGQGAELVRAKTFAALAIPERLSEAQTAPTQVFYQHSDRFHVLNIESGDPQLAETNLSVETIADLTRLESRLTLETETRSPANDREVRL